MTRKALSNILALLGLAVALIASALQAKAADWSSPIDAHVVVASVHVIRCNVCGGLEEDADSQSIPVSFSK